MSGVQGPEMRPGPDALKLLDIQTLLGHWVAWSWEQGAEVLRTMSLGGGMGTSA